MTPAASGLTEAEKNIIHDGTGNYDDLFAAVERILAARTGVADRVTAAMEALADHLCEYDPGHGDYPRAGLLIRAALTSSGSKE